MSKKSATENFFKTLATLNINIQKHAFIDDEVSELYYDDYYPGQEGESEASLEKQYRLFTNEVERDLNDKPNPIIYMRNLKRKFDEAESLFNSNREKEEKNLNAHPTMPTSKVSFFQTMAEQQKKFIKRTADYIDDMLWEVNPDKESGDGFQLKFNMPKQDVITLFMLLEGAGLLENNIGSKPMEWFLEKYVLWQEKGSDGEITYKKMKAVSTTLSKLRRRDVDADVLARQIKEDISTAEVEDRSDR
ncbi:hypothetical protein I0P70_02760 [Pontibacter sp. FD36]|uniref:hypothetical protein n=1 Tax=Pontibacter sp. FD36 TaxID=2789860 RepID=UPI0018AAEE8D|nr:hypothetical protein [Pontibacter sp. FD36]MBF8962155.1 hypothetical protein [Pontibacter sp. FD36]